MDGTTLYPRAPSVYFLAGVLDGSTGGHETIHRNGTTYEIFKLTSKHKTVLHMVQTFFPGPISYDKRSKIYRMEMSHKGVWFAIFKQTVEFVKNSCLKAFMYSFLQENSNIHIKFETNGEFEEEQDGELEYFLGHFAIMNGLETRQGVVNDLFNLDSRDIGVSVEGQYVLSDKVTSKLLKQKEYWCPEIEFVINDLSASLTSPHIQQRNFWIRSFLDVWEQQQSYKLKNRQPNLTEEQKEICKRFFRVKLTCSDKQKVTSLTSILGFQQKQRSKVKRYVDKLKIQGVIN